MKVISTEKAPAAIGPYSQAIEIGGMLLLPGRFLLTLLPAKCRKALPHRQNKAAKM